MKPKMKDSISNKLAILVMIGQWENMHEVVSIVDIAAWAGLSKQTTIQRVFKWVAMGYVEVHVNHWRGEAQVFHVSLTVEGQRLAYGNFALREYKSWLVKSAQVWAMRVGSTKSMFI